MSPEEPGAEEHEEGRPLKSMHSHLGSDPLLVPAGLPMRPFRHSLPMTLLRARAAVMAFFRPLHHERGVTEQQWRILRVLYETDEVDAMGLAERTLLMAPSLSRILPDLEKRKLINRRVSKADQRRSLISLAAAGRELVTKHGPNSERAYAEIERRFGRERLRQLYRLMWELEAVLTADLPDPPPDPGADFPQASSNIDPGSRA